MGSGNKGLYHGAAGPISNPGDVRYSKKKYEGYLLNLNHPIGASKAKFIHDVLGYSQSDGKLFHQKIVKAIQDKKPNKTEITPFGIKHIYHTKVEGKNGKSISANVVVVIQKDKGRRTFKIVTIYPDKKGEN